MHFHLAENQFRNSTVCEILRLVKNLMFLTTPVIYVTQTCREVSGIRTSSSVSSSGRPSNPLSSSSSTPLVSAAQLLCVCGFSLSVYTRVDAPNDMVESIGTCWGLWGSRRILPRNVPWAAERREQDPIKLTKQSIFHFPRIKCCHLSLCNYKFVVGIVVWGSLTAVEVNEKDPLKMSVVDQRRMDPRAGLVVYHEVTVVWIPPKQIELLLINDQFLKTLS